MRSMEAIQRAIQVFGSQAAMASVLGVKQPTISEWLRGERPIPAERCPQIERETRRLGQPILCEELRPDVAWDVLRTQGVPDAAEVDAPAIAEPHAEASDRRDPATEGQFIHSHRRATDMRDGPCKG